MNRENEIELNAYVDGELSADQQAEFLNAMQQDPQLAQQVCELTNMKAQLKLAYAKPPGIEACLAERMRPLRGALAAGMAMLFVGILSGWLLHANMGEAGRFVMLDGDGRGQAPAVADSPETRIVFHLTNPDQEVSGELLDEVETMLLAYRQDGRPLRVEIVSHGEGLGLLRERLSQHKVRIGQLASSFDNLTFVACQNTIERLKVERGIEVRIIPEAEMTRSGVTHVVKRQKQGWAYIRV